MALKIRLRQHGRANRQTYRLVVTDIRNPRDGKYLEMVGWYNPFGKGQESAVDAARINFWLDKGAELTTSAESIVNRVAPEVVKAIHAKRHASRIKQAAKRRLLRKKAVA